MGKGKEKGPTHASSVEIYLENTQCFPEDLACWRKLRDNWIQGEKLKDRFQKSAEEFLGTE